MYDDACKGNKARANSRYVLNRRQDDLLMPSKGSGLTAIAVCLPSRMEMLRDGTSKYTPEMHRNRARLNQNAL